MIQRIQTVFFLLISIVSVFVFFFIPPIDFPDSAFPITIVWKSYLIFTTAFAFLNLLMFKNRKAQLMINRVHFFLQIVVLTVLVYCLVNTDDFNPSLPCLVMPLFVIILLTLSSRAIRKDEDLIRSIDRLR